MATEISIIILSLTREILQIKDRKPTLVTDRGFAREGLFFDIVIQSKVDSRRAKDVLGSDTKFRLCKSIVSIDAPTVWVYDTLQSRIPCNRQLFPGDAVKQMRSSLLLNKI